MYLPHVSMPGGRENRLLEERMAFVGDVDGGELAKRVLLDDTIELGVEQTVVEGGRVLANHGHGFIEDLTVDKEDAGCMPAANLCHSGPAVRMLSNISAEPVEKSLNALEGEAVEVDDLSELGREVQEGEDALDEVDLSASNTSLRTLEERLGRGTLL